MPSIAAIIGFVIIMSIQRERTAQRQAEQAAYQTIALLPNPQTGGKSAYVDVQILDKSAASVTFRTSNGQVIEHHGTYQIETRKRDY